jgi:ankyrin repeat protein
MISHRFRWVFCQLEVLRSCFPANLRRILDELPKSLDDTYMRILKQINNANWEHAYRLLQCLTVAVRPLRVEELAEVLAVDFHGGGMPKLNTNWRWEDQKGAVLSACSSLVSVVTDNDSEVVQFSHFSVKEFLSSDRLASYTAEESRFHIPIEPSHVVLVQACFVVLLRLDGDIDADAAAKIPLLRYAAGHWYRHAQIGNVELQITDTLDHFFDMDNPCFSAWAQLERPLDLFDYSSESENLLPLAAPLYFAAARGLPRLVERLIVKHPEHINDDGGVDGTPFHASARLGNIEISQLLHACGAKINSSGQTPLHIASQEGHLEVGRWLIDCGADVNSQDMDHCTPLHWAAARGQIGFSRMLLKHKSKVNVRDDTKATPFLEASMSGKPELLQLLLDYKAHPHVRDSSGRTPLHKAAARGHVNIVRLLLELNAEVDARDDDGGTPLLRACEFWPGAPDVVQLLLDHNADLHVRDNKGRTGLHRAVAKGHLEVARLLLERNAEVNAQDDDGATPLLSASQFRKDIPDVVRLLLDNNADLHMHDDLGRTPLHHAVGRGHLEVARLLLFLKYRSYYWIGMQRSIPETMKDIPLFSVHMSLRPQSLMLCSYCWTTMQMRMFADKTARLYSTMQSPKVIPKLLVYYPNTRRRLMPEMVKAVPHFS